MSFPPCVDFNDCAVFNRFSARHDYSARNDQSAKSLYTALNVRFSEGERIRRLLSDVPRSDRGIVMKLAMRYSLTGANATFLRLLVVALTTAGPLAASGDEYFEDSEQLEPSVQQASNLATTHSPDLIHPMDGHSHGEMTAPTEAYADDLDATEVYPDAIHQEETTSEEWVDPTNAETCECTKTTGSVCPGVCKDPGHPKKPKHPRPGDIDEGDCPSKRYRMDDCVRSGDPNCVYKWAAPSITPKYSAWYVGGGAALKGRGRKSSEGTWGLDYDGLFGHARTWMNYTCGKKQGGEGAYETDHVPLKKKL